MTLNKSCSATHILESLASDTFFSPVYVNIVKPSEGVKMVSPLSFQEKAGVSGEVIS